ncbi:MAG: succinate semialdehyde dehydrogenase [Subtercola sp.]|nr:succinate semialdehyde dehydrogenase [Subtercola sp.]
MTDVLTPLGERLKDPTLLKDGALIDGEWIRASAADGFPLYNPATGEVICYLPIMGTAETRDAIASSEAALRGWRATSAINRSNILRKWAELMRDSADDIASILTAEQGKPWDEARGEVIYAAGYFDWFAEEGRRVYGDVIPSNTEDARIIVLKQPVGVTAGITPWNLPAAMITRKVGPALAAGNTIVVKPAALTPLTATAIAELGLRAGLPRGVFNIVTTSKASEIGDEFTSNPVVRKLSFTGSTGVGRHLMRQAATNIQKVSMELGGNSPFIIFDDADIDQAVEGVVSAKFRNAGQICTAANRIFVQRGAHDRFAEALKIRAQNVNVGNGFGEGVEMGPLIDQKGFEKAEAHVQDMLDHGAILLAGGHAHELGRTFFEPTVITGLESDMLPWSDETFGPIASIAVFDDEDEVIAKANDTEYGLVAYLYTHDLGRTFRVSEALETGMVGVNTGRVSNQMAPFGGVKQSGLGREGSKYGIDDWLELKYINLAGLSR